MKTKEIIISVCVTADGQWNAVSWSGEDRKYLDEKADDGLEEEHDVRHVVHVKATVPIPDNHGTIVVEGEVVSDG